MSAAKGEMRDDLGHIIDIMPTVVALTGATYPTEFNGKPILPEEGTSLVPALTRQPVSPDRPLFWEHEGNRAIHEGKWKLVALRNRPWELYDFVADRTELHDLAAQNPDVVQKLSAEWDAWAKRVGAAEAFPDVRPMDGMPKGAKKGGERKAAEQEAPDA
jgi:arylsulfatase